MRKNLFAGEGGSIYLFGLCGASILGTALYYILAGRTGSFDGMSVVDWVLYAVNQIAFVAVVIGYGAARRVDILSVAKVRPAGRPAQYALLVPIAVVSIAAFFPLYMLFTALLSVMGYPTGGAVSMPAFSNAGTFILSVFVMAVLPAIGEELFMRGAVLPALASRGTWFGVFISALLFSLMHANPMQTIYQFCFGAVLAVVFMLSRSLLPCVVLHFLSNFFTLVLTAYIPEVDAVIASLGAYNWLTGTVSFVVGSLLLVWLLWLYRRAGKPRAERESYRVSDAGIVFDDCTLYAYSDDALPAKPKRAGAALIESFKFVGSMFTKKGWKAAERELFLSAGIPYAGKTQPMLGVWLAIGFSAVYWALALLRGLAL